MPEAGPQGLNRGTGRHVSLDVADRDRVFCVMAWRGVDVMDGSKG